MYAVKSPRDEFELTPVLPELKVEFPTTFTRCSETGVGLPMSV